MSKGQQRRAEVVNRVLSGRVSKDEAEMLLGLSRRQVNRVLNGYRDLRNAGQQSTLGPLVESTR